MGHASVEVAPRRRRRAWALAAGCGLATLATLAVLAAAVEAQWGGIVLDNGVASVGFRETANLGFEGPLPSTQPCAPSPLVPVATQCNFMVGLREDATNFEGLTDNCVCEGWGVAYTDPAPVSGWAQWGQPMRYDGLDGIFFFPNPSAQSATSIVRIGDLAITHAIQPETLGTTLFRINVTIQNLGTQPVSGIVYRRVMDWDAEPTPYNEFVTISGSPTAITVPAVPELLCSTWDPWVHADPSAIELDDPILMPPVGPGSQCGGAPATYGAADRGAAFDFASRSLSNAATPLGTLGPGEYTRMLMYYGASRDSTVLTDLVAINAQLVSIARPAYPQALAPVLTGPLDPPVHGPFMTYAFAYRWECVPGLDPACTQPPCADPNAPGCNPCPNPPCPPQPVVEGPQADFDAVGDDGSGLGSGDVCTLTVQFYDESQPGTSPIVAWEWQFGDGANSVEQNPVHTYDYPGSYTVTLTVYDQNGNTDTYRGSVRVGECPPETNEDPAEEPKPPNVPRDGESDDGGLDTDGDGIRDRDDLCPNVSDPLQHDLDEDRLGDACDPDLDGDAVRNEADNCVDAANPDQADLDRDALGDACDPDLDGDGIPNDQDNCAAAANRDQSDRDGDGLGDACEGLGSPDGKDAVGRLGLDADASALAILKSPLREIALSSAALLAVLALVLVLAARRRADTPAAAVATRAAAPRTPAPRAPAKPGPQARRRR